MYVYDIKRKSKPGWKWEERRAGSSSTFIGKLCFWKIMLREKEKVTVVITRKASAEWGSTKVCIEKEGERHEKERDRDESETARKIAREIINQAIREGSNLFQPHPPVYSIRVMVSLYISGQCVREKGRSGESGHERMKPRVMIRPAISEQQRLVVRLIFYYFLLYRCSNNLSRSFIK